MLVACVLRSGGGFGPDHVAALHRQVGRWLPGVEFFALSDLEVECSRMPMLHCWPGFWSKMELFRPTIAPTHDLLYLDLDTVVLSDLSWVRNLRRFTMARDFFYPARLSSTMMFLPASFRPRVWELWMRNPAAWVKEYATFHKGTWGDGAFLDDAFGEEAVRFQAAFPGRLLSYKADVLNGEPIGPEASVLCFHGQPRPWDVSDPTVLKALAH